MRHRGILTLGLALATLAPATARDYIYRIIDDAYDTPPYHHFEEAAMNASGVAVYGAALGHPEEEIRIAAAAGPRVLVSRASGYSNIREIALNDNGLTVFATESYPPPGIYGTYDGQSFTTILDPNAGFSWIEDIVVNNQGLVAFAGRPPTYGWGLYTTDGAVLTQIAHTDDGIDVLEDSISINDAGAVAFSARINGVDGVFLADGGGITPIALAEGEIVSVGSPYVDNDGAVYFRRLSGGGVSGIYRSEAGVVSPVVESGAQFASVADGFTVGPDGSVAFNCTESDDSESVFVATPTEVRRVIKLRGSFYGMQLSDEYVRPASMDAGGRVLLNLPLNGYISFYALVVATPAPDPFEIIHVKSDATGHDDGTSWDDAFANLRDALDFAAPGDQVWLAAGTHRPDHTRYGSLGSRAQLFLLQAGASIYGGFAGDELTLDDRAGLFDQTILSGDLNGDDEPNFVNYEDNSYVVMAAGYELGAPCTIDGLTITAGALGQVYIEPPITVFGAGLSINTDAVVRNCAFMLNRSTSTGGGVVATGGMVAFEDCNFVGNQRNRNDGAAGLYVDRDSPFAGRLIIILPRGASRYWPEPQISP